MRRGARAATAASAERRARGSVAPRIQRLWPGLAGQDDVAVLAGIAGMLCGDLHGVEHVRVGCAPHGEAAVAAAPGCERACGDQLGVAWAIGRPGIPAFIKLARAELFEAMHAEADRPAARFVGGPAWPPDAAPEGLRRTMTAQPGCGWVWRLGQGPRPPRRSRRQPRPQPRAAGHSSAATGSWPRSCRAARGLLPRRGRLRWCVLGARAAAQRRVGGGRAPGRPGRARLPPPGSAGSRRDERGSRRPRRDRVCPATSPRLRDGRARPGLQAASIPSLGQLSAQRAHAVK
jgi:hypothetical protein